MNGNAATFTGPVIGANPVFDSAVVIAVPAVLAVTVGKLTADAAKDFPDNDYTSTWTFGFGAFTSTMKVAAPYNIVLAIKKPAAQDRV